MPSDPLPGSLMFLNLHQSSCPIYKSVKPLGIDSTALLYTSSLKAPL